jgi:hypothetical protein
LRRSFSSSVRVSGRRQSQFAASRTVGGAGGSGCLALPRTILATGSTAGHLPSSGVAGMLVEHLAQQGVVGVARGAGQQLGSGVPG